MECKDNAHRIRENNFGVTWCVKCGRLFQSSRGRFETKPIKKLTKEDEKYYIR